jgi:hypothetical protein
MTTVSNPSADADEKIERAARVLRASRQNKDVFKAIYKGKRRFKSVEDLKRSVTNFTKKTYAAAARLAAEDIVDKKKQDGLMLYGKKDFYTHHRDRILRMSESLDRIKKAPTKRKIQIQIKPSRTYSFGSRPKVQQVYIDDVDSFQRIRRFSKGDLKLVRDLPERVLNRAICGILNQSDKKDWGGERHDIYTNRISFRGARRSAAFALKGRATKGLLTPGKMGKNGDQVQRLFESTADIYVIGYIREIDDRIVDLMQTHAIKNSLLANRKVAYCVIDGADVARLMAAYPAYFG